MISWGHIKLLLIMFRLINYELNKGQIKDRMKRNDLICELRDHLKWWTCPLSD
jgi:hypothetical protein